MANIIPISTVTVGSGGAATIGFTGIPQIYTDLIVKTSVAITSNDIAFATLKFNGSSSNFSYRAIEGNASTLTGITGSTAPFGVPALTSYTSAYSNIEFYIANYSSASYKTYHSSSVQEWNTATVYTHLIVGLWSNTAPITSIELTPASGNWKQYSTATLYGIRKY
jgi:hypothetical protein